MSDLNSKHDEQNFKDAYRQQTGGNASPTAPATLPPPNSGGVKWPPQPRSVTTGQAERQNPR